MKKLDKKEMEKLRKTYAVSLNRELMLKLQHPVFDENKSVNDRKPANDLLKKYRKINGHQLRG